MPVAILSFNKDGSEQVFAGCYTARLVNPAIQEEPPFRPLHIEKGSLKPSDLSYEEAVPASCPDAPPPEATDAVLRRRKPAFEATHIDCDRNLPGGEPSQIAAEVYKIPFRYASDTDDQPERQARLFRFFCGAGAYNESHVYYQYDEDQRAARAAVRRRPNSTSATRTTIPKARSRASPSSATDRRDRW